MKLCTICSIGLAAALLLTGCTKQPSANSSGITAGSVSIGAPATGSSSQSGSQSSSSSDPAAPTERYQKLVADKARLIAGMRTVAEAYRNNATATLGGSFAAWPADYPAAATLPMVVSADQFAVRQGEGDTADSVYLALPIDATHELRVEANIAPDYYGNPAGEVKRAWFVTKSQTGYPWTLTDSDPYTTTDEELYAQALRAYGAEDFSLSGEKGLFPTLVSLYYLPQGFGEMDSPLTAKMAFLWFESSQWSEFSDYRDKVYAHPDPAKRSMMVYPQALYETRVQRYFDVDAETLRGDERYYHPELGGYAVEGGGAKGEAARIQLTGSRKEGAQHRLSFTLDYEYSPDTRWVMTIEVKPDGSFRYVSVLPAAV